MRRIYFKPFVPFRAVELRPNVLYFADFGRVGDYDEIRCDAKYRAALVVESVQIAEGGAALGAVDEI